MITPEWRASQNQYQSRQAHWTLAHIMVGNPVFTSLTLSRREPIYTHCADHWKVARMGFHEIKSAGYGLMPLHRPDAARQRHRMA